MKNKRIFKVIMCLVCEIVLLIGFSVTSSALDVTPAEDMISGFWKSAPYDGINKISDMSIKNIYVNGTVPTEKAYEVYISLSYVVGDGDDNLNAEAKGNVKAAFSSNGDGSYDCYIYNSVTDGTVYAPKNSSNLFAINGVVTIDMSGLDCSYVKYDSNMISAATLKKLKAPTTLGSIEIVLPTDSTFKETAGGDAVENIVAGRTYSAAYSITVTGGSGVSEYLYSNEAQVFEITADSPEAGYGFSKWTLTADDGVAQISNVNTATTTLTVNAGKSGNIRLAASYTEVVSYSITYEENGGDDLADASYTYGTGVLALPTPTRVGYDFAGWYTDSEFSGEAITSISETETGDKVFYAMWTAKTNVAYVVEHYIQNADGTYSAVASFTDNKTGTTGATVDAEQIDLSSYPGLIYDDTALNVVSGNIVPDGTLVLKLYYKRQSIVGISADNVSADYDAEYKSVTVNGIASGDVITYSTSENGVFGNTAITRRDSGTTTVYYKVERGYYLPYVGSATITVNKVSITLDIAMADKVYDGAADEASAAVSGVVNGETVVLVYTYSGAQLDGTPYTASTSAPVNAGNYTVTVSLSDAAVNGNYEISGAVTKEYRITRMVLSIPSADTNTYTYNGSAQTYIITAGNYNVDDNIQVAAGSYTVTVSLSDSNNYKWTPEAGATEDDISDKTYAFVINKKSITLDIAMADKVYDGAADEASAAVSGVVNGETVVLVYTYSGAQLDGTPYTASTSAPVNAGNYTVTVSLSDAAVNGNYEIIGAVAKEYRITRLATSIPSADTTEYTYNGNEQTYVIASSSNYSVSGNVQKNANENGYTVKVSLNDTNNYKWNIASATEDDISNKTYTFIIYRKEITVTITAGDNCYGNVTPASATFNGVVTGENVDAIYLYEGVANDGTAYSDSVAPTKAGTYTVTVSINASNYVLGGTASADFIIERANVDIPVADATVFIYNGQAHTYQIAPSSLYTVNGELTKTAANESGYPVSVTLNDTDNYRWTPVSGAVEDDVFVKNYSFVIERREITVSFDNCYFEYGSVFGATVRFNNLVYKESVYPIFRYEGEATDGSQYAGFEAPYKAGEYTVSVSIANTNYELVGIVEADFIISKKQLTVPMEDGTDYIYNARPQIYAIARDEAYSVTGAEHINAGAYEVEVKITDKFNYEWETGDTDDLTYDFLIAKAKQWKPDAVTTDYYYNGSEQTYGISGNGNFVITGNKRTVVGEQTVTVSLADKSNYVWSDGTQSDLTYTFKILRGVYDMSTVKFENVTVVDDGSAKSIQISGDLPNGVTVTYEGNEKTAAGVYTVTAKFTGDSENYEAIPDMKATLTVKVSTADSGNDYAGEKEVVVSAEKGIDPTYEIVIAEIENSASDVESKLVGNEKIGVIYEISIKRDGVSVQPDGNLVIKLLIPEQLRQGEFKILHVHGQRIGEIKYTVDGNYAIVETEELSEFVFVYKETSISWLIALLIVIIVMEIVLIVIQLFAKKGVKACAIAPGMLAMFFPTGQIPAVVVMGTMVVLIGAANIIIYVISKKKNNQ